MDNGPDDEDEDYEDDDEYDADREAEEHGWDENKRMRRLGLDPEGDPIDNMRFIDELIERFELLDKLKKVGLGGRTDSRRFKRFIAGSMVLGSTGSGLFLCLVALSGSRSKGHGPLTPPANDNDQSDATGS